MKSVENSINKANVLIVGGHSSNLEILMRILSCKKYNIKSVFNDKLALQFLEENQPDIILLEISNMSDMDGFEVCKTFKNNQNINGNPIIFINTYKENINIDKGKVFDMGGADYLTIPFNEQEVIARIETHLKLRFMELEMIKLSSYNEKLIKANSDLEYMIDDKTKQLKEITIELKEFNVMLGEEISERTKTEEALKESESHFRHAIEKAPLPIMLYTENGEVKKINRTWTSITGYKLSDMPTISEWAKISDVFIEQFEDDGVNRVFDMEGRLDEGEYTIRISTGENRIWYFYSAYIGQIQDGQQLSMRVAIDITERKNMDELQKRIEEEQKKLYEVKEYDRIKTEFFSNISHELRTPINVIFSALQVHELKLKNSPASHAEVYKYVDIMKQNCYRLLRLINNLIDITKIDSGYFDIEENNIDIVNLVENITLSVADYIENKGLSLIFDTTIEEKIMACDPEKIERIILNLLSNAVKFTSLGGEIMVTIEESIENIYISVKDTGKGIPEDKLNSIFERFVQVDKSLTRDNEGSGIGLSLVKCLVELHDGTIAVQSREGYGAKFTICIPCKLVDRANCKIPGCESRGENLIEKISLEFADIYK